MAITASQFENCMVHALKGELPDLSATETIVKCALLSEAPTGSEDTYEDISTNEITGTGYTEGGNEVTDKSITQASGVTTFDADNVSWPESTLDAIAAVIYEESTGYLISFIDFDEVKSSNNGNFEIQWDEDGIFTVTIA